MVPNITSGSSFYGVIAYNKIKMDDGTASENCSRDFGQYTD